MPSNYTMLQGINQVLQKSNIQRVAAVASTGTWPTKTYLRGDEADAEEAIDRATKDLCLEGLPSCLSVNKKFTLASPGPIQVGQHAVKVVGKVNLENARITLQPVTSNANVWNIDGGTDQWAAGDYFLDVYTDKAFESLNGPEQVMVLSRALEYFQQSKMPELIDARGITLAEARGNANIAPVGPAMNQTQGRSYVSPQPASRGQQQ
jgi:hypothetical protein